MADVKGKNNYEKMPQVGGVDIVPSGGTTGQVLQKVNATNYNTQWAAPPTSVYGTQSQYAASNGESTTTSGTYQQKLRLTTPSIPAGTYRIGFAAVLQNDGGAGGTWRCELDDTTLLMEAGTVDSSTNDPTANGSFWHGSLTTGVHTIDIDYLAVSSTTRISYARIEIHRIS